MRLLIAISVIVLSFGCSKYDCECTDYATNDPNDPNIIGSYCNDGTTSTSTGSGTCSGHGGVSSYRAQNCVGKDC